MENNKIKCLIWDLDNTLWDGVLLESKNVILKEEIKDILEILDSRGILLSIVSKNDFDHAIGVLKDNNIDHLFLYPQIGWNAKSYYVKKISELLNISLNTIAFIDDDPFEREEVSSTLAEVICLDAVDYRNLVDMDIFMPYYITDESKRRRNLYIQDSLRKSEENNFKGPANEFLKSLHMDLSIMEAEIEDLYRCEELIKRTSQLNSTGIVYTLDELKTFVHDNSYNLIKYVLSDKYGSYGIIGLCLLQKSKNIWKIKLVITSCRVMSRGIGNIILMNILQKANTAKVKVAADFHSTNRNRPMYIAFKLLNFIEVSRDSFGNVVLENDLSSIPSIPDHINLISY